jgi:hypothetical protein
MCVQGYSLRLRDLAAGQNSQHRLTIIGRNVILKGTCVLLFVIVYYVSNFASHNVMFVTHDQLFTVS